MHAPREVRVATRSLARFRPLIGPSRYAELRATALRARNLLANKTVWNLSTTAAGGGVAEMLYVLVGYILSAGVDIRWMVMTGDSDFFRITKRIHNRLHGFPGDHGGLGAGEAAHFESVADANAQALLPLVRAGDVVLLHDPQALGLARPLCEAGAIVVWRSHIGAIESNDCSAQAWEFLRPHLGWCHAYVFSRRDYAPSWLPAEHVAVICPSIDPFSHKNRDLAPGEVRWILKAIGVLAGDDPGTPPVNSVGKPLRPKIRHRATVVTDGMALDPAIPLVVQVSRWDHLKDMQGTMEGFAAYGCVGNEAHLALVGPQVDAVSDDPEGRTVLEECIAAWDRLPARLRRRIHLLTLPMVNIHENALMVNALQRHAATIVQKSLAEGFGLTVAEAMWKGRAVMASAVGGVVEQMTPETGVLLTDPTDLEAYGESLAALLSDPDKIALLGRNARHRVLERFVGDKHLIAHAKLIERIVATAGSGPVSSVT